MFASYFVIIIFQKQIIKLNVLSFEEILFQIMTLENFNEIKQAFKDISMFYQNQLYPVVLKVMQVYSIDAMSEKNIHIHPEALWELNINNYFYKMVNANSATLINYSMFYVNELIDEYVNRDNYNMFRNIEFDYEPKQICKYNGICNQNNYCRECEFSYKNFREYM